MKSNLKVKSLEFIKDENSWQLKDKAICKYEISHNNGRLTLSQDVTIQKTYDGYYIPNIEITDFPKTYTSADDAMIKYADWLMRLGMAIKIKAKEKSFSKIEF